MSDFYTKAKGRFGRLALRLFKVKVINNKPFPNEPFIVCSNHTSLFDVVVVVAGLEPKIRYMAKKEAFKYPLVSRFIKNMGAFPVDRKKGDVAAIKTTLNILKEGECVGIFPQGTRCPKVDPRTTEVKDGIGMIAARAGVGILPVCIKTKKNKLKMFHRTYCIVGDYIPPSELAFEGLGGREKYEKISRLAFERVCELNDVDFKSLKEPKKPKALPEGDKK